MTLLSVFRRAQRTTGDGGRRRCAGRGAAMLAASGVILAALSAGAQVAGGAYKPKPRDPRHFLLQKVDKQPDLPDMPVYPERNCLVEGGERFPNLPTGTLYNYRLMTYEPLEHVKEWYRGQLQGRNWKIDPRSVSTTVLRATREDNHNFVNVSFTAATRKPYKTMVLITYKLANK